MNKEKFNPTERSKVKTNAVRAVYEKEEILKIIDDTFHCHIGFKVNNQPIVLPICYGRKGDKIFFHGAKANRMFSNIKNGSEICLTISIVDGIVLARSAFNHIINYRSVVIFGKASEIIIPAEKEKALRNIIEHIIPGRWNDIRKPSEKELNATSTFYMELNEVSAKIRNDPPIDDDEDLKLEIWSGILPLKVINQEPIKDPYNSINNNIPTPDYIKNYRKK